MAIIFCSLRSRFLWSVVSKAALRSNKTSTETSPLSDAVKRLFVTLTSVVFCAMIYSKSLLKILKEAIVLQKGKQMITITFSGISKRK